MGIISTNLKMSESSAVLEALLFIYARRVKLIPYMYLVITDFDKRLDEKMKKESLGTITDPHTRTSSCKMVLNRL
jgi:hypothetical protein